MADEQGRWVTINGTHVFIKDGETLEQAMARQFDTSSWEDDDYRGRLYDAFEASFGSVDWREIDSAGNHYQIIDKATNKRIMPKQQAKYRLRQLIDKRDMVRSDVDDAIVGALTHVVHQFDAKNYGTSFYDPFKDRIFCNIVDWSPQFALNTLGHEIAHAIDEELGCSRKMNAAMQYEKPSLDDITAEVTRLRGKMKDLNQRFGNKEIQWAEFQSLYSPLSEAVSSLADLSQMLYGDEDTKAQISQLGHKAGYFSNGVINTSELFAELTGERFAYSQHPLRDWLEIKCPGVMAVYDEQIEMANKQWRK